MTGLTSEGIRWGRLTVSIQPAYWVLAKGRYLSDYVGDYWAVVNGLTGRELAKL